jgi:putative ABC transport system permease protein
MSVIWKKIWRDLTRNRSRTILAVLSTAVGVFALGLVINMSAMMNARIAGQTADSVPATIRMYAAPLDDTLAGSFRKQAGVADAEILLNGGIRWKRAGDSEWHDGSLVGREDFAAQRTDIASLTAGHWPGRKSLAMEQQTMTYYGLRAGDRILVQHGGTERSVEITGVARSTQTIPPQYQGSTGSFFATPETIEWLTGDKTFNQLNIRLDTWDETRANTAAKAIEQQLKSAGITVGGYEVRDPAWHFSKQIVDGIFIILTGMGIISLGLSAFLIVNTLNALLAQQIWQIGIFKVLGATTRRVTEIYLGVALLYGMMAIGIAIPLSALAAQLMAGWMLSTINISAGAFHLVPASIVIQLIVGMVIPILSALAPVLGGARISCRQAISNYGLGGGFGSSLIDRGLLNLQKWVPPLQRTPRPVMLSLRNTFRRKARVALTLVTLTLGGVMFIMVMGVNLSLHRMLDVVLNDFGFSVMMSFDRVERSEKLVSIASGIPGVIRAEAWDVRGADMVLPSGEKTQTQLWALPPESQLFHFNIAAGRSLLPADDRAILINRKIGLEKHLQVGDVVTLNVGGHDSSWTIVGWIINMNTGQRDSFVPLNALARETGTVQRSASVVIQLAQDDPATEQAAITQLRTAFIAAGLNPNYIMGVSAIRQTNEYQFNLLVNILLIMAVLAAVVGSLGLAGTMSINVVERGREIGLMRAIGAASPMVASIFMGEGLLLGVVSWALAVPLSIPGGILFTGALSQALFPMDFAFSAQGALTWLVIVSVLSVLASLWPALRATRISVRESLAYE